MGIREGASRRAAISRMAEKMGTAVLLTFVTTYVGFLSIAVNDIELLYQFSLLASTGLLCNFLITVVLVPVMLRTFGHRHAGDPQDAPRESLYQRWAVGLLLIVQRRRRFVFAGAAILAVVALLAASQLRINNNLLDYLDEQSALRVHADRIHTELSGIHAFSIVLDSGIDNTFLQVKYLGELEKIQRFNDRMGHSTARSPSLFGDNYLDCLATITSTPHGKHGCPPAPLCQGQALRVLASSQP